MDSWLDILWIALGGALIAATVLGTLELGVLTVASLLPPRREGRADSELRLAVVVPAHDEAAGIARTVASLLACETAGGEVAVVVVAHNCSDATAENAARAGARVLVLDDATRRGKSYALDHAFGILLGEGYDACAVVDGDTEVEPHLLGAMRGALAAGADGVQARYQTLSNDGDDLRGRIRQIAFAGMNVVRPRGRARIGASAGILGNGFALSRATLQALPYDVHSIAEDLAYHVRMVRAGRSIRFLDDVTVRGAMPTQDAATRVQSARWEGGRLGIARLELGGLLGDLLRGRLRSLEPMLDLLLLPLGYHVPLLVAGLLVPWWPSQICGAVGLAVVALHVVAAVRASGGGWKAWGSLAAVPFYVLWKLGGVRAVLRGSRRDADWVRTPR